MPKTNSTSPIRAAKPAAKDANFLTRIADTLGSLMSGMGTEKDKLATIQFTNPLMTQPEQDAAYRGDWMARKLVNIPAYDATREWRSWQGDQDDITHLEDTERTLGVLRKVMVAKQMARLYGGAALILGVNQGRNEDELNYDTIKAGDLKFVHPVTRYDISAGPMVRDIQSPYFGEAEYYERAYTTTPAGDGALGTKFHPSRVIRFVGAERLDFLQSNEVWGDSILMAISDAIKAAGLVSNSGAQLVAEAKVDIIRIPGLSESMATQAYENKLTKRFAVANMIKGVYSMLLLDKEEEWQRQNATFTGLDSMLQMYLLMTCGAGDVPATRFLGQSPAGLSSTGESDLRNYYDNVGTVQKTEYSPALAKLDNVLIPSALGSHPEELFYVWNSLWQMTAKEKAEVNKAQADTYKIDVDSQLLDPLVLKKARENQIIENQTYPGFEQILEEWDGKGFEEEEKQARLNAEMFQQTQNDPNNDPSLQERTPNDPNANPDKMPEAGKPKKPAPKKKPTQDRRKIGDAIYPGTFAHMRKRVNDATPRTLYIHRELLNVDDIKAWAKAQGFASIVDDLHVTLIYSKTPVNWLEMGTDNWGEDSNGVLVVHPGGPRMMEQFGEAQVLVFGSDALTYRNMRLREQGCEFNFNEYNPHVTITYRGLPADQFAKVEPYRGELRFGPEIFKEIDTNFNNETDVKERSMSDAREVQL